MRKVELEKDKGRVVTRRCIGRKSEMWVARFGGRGVRSFSFF